MSYFNEKADKKREYNRKREIEEYKKKDEENKRRRELKKKFKKENPYSFVPDEFKPIDKFTNDVREQWMPF